jgi:hypothetical protein
MWSGNQQPYKGKYYQLARLLNSPQCVQKPHPPSLIGGGGERKTLRLVAKYADACNIFARLGIDVLQHKLDVLREHCQAVGRPYEQIEKTTLDSLSITRDGRNNSMTAAAMIDYLGNLAARGIDQAIFSLRNVTEAEPFEILATQIVPEAEKIKVAGR